MLKRQKDGMHWLEFELLGEEKQIKHAIFTRHGGKSAPPYDSLNLSSYVGDNPIDVDSNLASIQALFNMPIAKAKLEHGSAILPVSKTHLQHQGDGLTTNQAGMALLMTHADCQAALFFDPIQCAIANIHCGWRGNVQNIYAKAVKWMHAHYKSNPKNLLVCISPSLGPVAAEFIHYEQELPLSLHAFQIQKNYFDFWQISKSQLLDCGILEHHIEIAEICTFSDPQNFFSYRRDKVTGRNGTVIAIKP